MLRLAQWRSSGAEPLPLPLQPAGARGAPIHHASDDDWGREVVVTAHGSLKISPKQSLGLLEDECSEGKALSCSLRAGQPLFPCPPTLHSQEAGADRLGPAWPQPWWRW